MANFENVGGSDSCFMFEYPEGMETKFGTSGLTLSKRNFYLMLARNIESDAPERAAFYRQVASHYPDCDNHGYGIDRDGNRAILVDFDDWDELTDEQRLLRGNRNAAIAVLDRLRFHLEMMDDEPANKEEVDDIRRALNDLIEPLSFA